MTEPRRYGGKTAEELRALHAHVGDPEHSDTDYLEACGDALHDLLSHIDELVEAANASQGKVIDQMRDFIADIAS